MIITKETATEEEQALLLELTSYIQKELHGELALAIEDINDEAFRKAHAKLVEASEKRGTILDNITERYISSIVNDKDLILANAAEIINAYTKADYKTEVDNPRKGIKKALQNIETALKSGTLDEQRAAVYKKLLANNMELLSHYAYSFEAVRVFLNNLVQNEREALKRGGHGEAELEKLLDKRAGEIFPRKANRKPITPEELAAYNAQIGEQLSLFESPFMPMLQGQLTSVLMPMNTKRLTPERLRGGDAIAKPKPDYTVIIKGYDKLQGDLGVSAKKILDTATVALTQRVTYLEENPLLVNPTVEIDLLEYARANGYKVDRSPVDTPEEAAKQETAIAENIKKLKDKLDRDLDYISNISQTFKETKGRNAGDYTMIRIISSHSIKRGKIRINFDADAARYLSKAYVMQYPTALLKHDNRNPNSYAIGRKIAYHNSMDNNVIIGTANTLSVLSLLEAAPEIQTLDELKAKGRRDWKPQIKEKLEKALDDNISIGYLSRWEYSDKHHNPLTRERAAELTAEEYLALYVDFVVIDAPDQSGRLAAKAEKKQLSDKPKRKRGRTPKKKE